MGILSADTSFEAEAVQMEILRRLGPVARLEQLAEATELSWQLLGTAASGNQRLERWLGRSFPILEMKGQEILKPITTPLMAASSLENLGIPYVIGGSYASSIHGEPRSTRDCDFLVELGTSQIDLLISEFEADFYVSREAVEEAVQLKRSFNLIHLKSGFKIDLFVSQDRDYDRERLSRGIALEIQGCKIRVSSAEDTILSKLEWYSLSPTDQQWRDILGVLLVQSDNIDHGYLKHWAKDLRLDALLQRALEAVKNSR